VRELKKELGNIIFSTIRWVDDLGLDVLECLDLAIEASDIGEAAMLTDTEKLRHIGRLWKKLNDHSKKRHGVKGEQIVSALAVLELAAPDLFDLLDSLPGSILSK